MTRFDVTQYLNNFILGFLEGSDGGIKQSVARRLKWEGLNVTEDNITVICDELQTPIRRMLSVHVECDGEHYESISKNILYDTGDDNP